MMNLKQSRKMKGLSQLRLAHLTKISKYRIFMAEQGFLKLTETEMKKINKQLTSRSGEVQ